MKKVLFWVAAPVVVIITGITLFGTESIGCWQSWISAQGGK